MAHMQRILSGIRPSGQLHLGNYLGAIKQWIDLQAKHEVFYMVADLHAITTPFNPKELPQQVRDTVIDYLAARLDPNKATIFIQSHVPAHCQLMWLLNTITPVGELQRMVQFKEKAEQHKDYQNAGILNYPILQAADILAYKPAYVPVGEDQVQHVEISRDLAKKFNRLFGETFPEPQPMLTGGKRIMDLLHPDQKMSKSTGGGILLSDSETTITNKIAKAVTSSEPRVIREACHAAAGGIKGADQPWKGNANLEKQYHGVRNLFTILFALAPEKDSVKWQTAAEDGGLKFSEFKPALAKIIADHFAPFRTGRAALVKDHDYVDEVIAAGNTKAATVADKTLAEVQTKMGLR